MRVPVRATRAYLAGFGTAGSLVAGAALLFLLGSAIVAFRGWPQIGAAPTTTVVAAARVSSPSHVAQRVAAVLSRRTRGRGSAAGHTGTLAARRGTHAIRPSGFVGGVTVHSGGTGATSVPSGAPTAGTSSSVSASSSTGCGSSCDQPAPQNAIADATQNAITPVTNTVSEAVSTVGAQVGGQVTQTSGAVGGALSGTSPQAATTVQSVGTAAGSAVSGTATTAGGVVSTVDGSLSGGH